MFRTLIYPSSGVYDYSAELPHWSYYSWFDVCWSFGVVGLEWYPCCRLKPASACNTDTTPSQPHRNSNTHRTKNNTINVVIQQNSRKLLIMDILMSETCWVHKKWNKIASDIKFVFYSSIVWIYLRGLCCRPYWNFKTVYPPAFFLNSFLAIVELVSEAGNYKFCLSRLKERDCVSTKDVWYSRNNTFSLSPSHFRLFPFFITLLPLTVPFSLLLFLPSFLLLKLSS